MGLFSKKKTPEQQAALDAPVASAGTINGLTKDKGRGFISETGTGESIYFNREACADFDTLAMGQKVTFMKERDPRDHLRVHALEVRRSQQ